MPFGLPRFHYRLINRETIQEISDLLVRGDSTVLLGPRGAGKRYIIEVLTNKWLAEKIPFRRLEFDSSTLLKSEVDLVHRLCETLALPQVRSLEEWLQLVAGQPGHHGILLLPNVDGLASDLCRQFLGTLMTLVQAGSITVAISGESNLIQLVHGPTSEFNCCDQFVIQAHGQREFLRFLTKRMRAMGFCWDRPIQAPAARREKRSLSEIKQAIRHLYHLTGGDVVLLRAFLFCISEHRVHHLARVTLPTPLPEPPDDLGLDHLVPTGGLVPFRYLIRCIETAPETWSLLLDMLEEREIPVAEDAPSALELAGLLRRQREPSAGDACGEPVWGWTWASLYTQRFATRYFDRKRMGDLFGIKGQWRKAFQYYNYLSIEQKQRPLSNEDGIHVRNVLASAANELHRLSTQDEWRGPLRNFLGHVALQLFGFDAVAFNEVVADEWTCVHSMGSRVPQKPRQPPSDPEIGKGYISVVAAGAEVYCCRNTFLDRKHVPHEAVILEPMADRGISVARYELIRELLEAYKVAWEHGWLQELQRQGRERREGVLKLTPELLEHVGNSAWAEKQMLIYASNRIPNMMSVRRVIALLPSARGGSHQWTVIHDTKKGADSEVTLPPDAQEVVRRRYPTSWRYRQAPQWVKDIQGTHEWDGVMMVPLLRRSDPPDSGAPPPPATALLLLELPANFITQELEETFEIFSGRLHSILEASRNYSLLLQILNPSRNPTILLGSDGLIRFASDGALDTLTRPGHFNQSSGWLETPSTPHGLGCDKKVCAHLDEMLEIKERTCVAVQDLTGRMTGTWLADVFPLKEWNSKSAGVAIVYRNRSFLFNFFDAMRSISTAQQVPLALNKFIEKLAKYSDFIVKETNAEAGAAEKKIPGVSIRVYMAERDRLVGAYCSGMWENEEKFRNGEFTIKPEDDHGLGYRAIKERRPMVFRWDPRSTDDKTHTMHGVHYLCVRDMPVHSKVLGRNEGDFWIDVPIFVNGSIYGKITCAIKSEVGEQLQPEILELLNLQVFALGDVIDRIGREEELIKQTSDTLATTAHGLVNSFAILELYAARLEENDEPEDVPRLMREFVKVELASLKRIKDRYSEIVLRPEHGDLVESIHVAMSRHSGPMDRDWSWQGGLRPAPVWREWDTQLVGEVIKELAQNSRVWKSPDRPLHMTVAVRIRRNYAIVEVADNGVGVPPLRKKSIFNKLATFRDKSMERSTGWGLYHVKRIVDAMMGRVTEKGRLGQGARFVFILPL